MTSNTTGDRRWGSTRKGGMTILGKVAVPKPINLPSQRLENHGVDPSVEIVPKGSLSWGTRSSSSGNAWGSSSALSPGTESPSHLNGRPSSSGGSRPSTAGSEKNPDTSSNAWIANSRPSSASRVLSANTSTLAALRPHSAENRPGSSQLSRFAEPLSEATAARVASGVRDKQGVGASLNDGFSLSSGDFPVLGEEKVSGKNAEILDCDSNSRPGSSGPSATPEKMEAVHGDDVKSGVVNSWENDGPHPGMERWHGDSYPYPSPNFPSHPYESWRGGRPVNPPGGGGWFRGPAGAPPYGTPQMAPAGGFPMEPFPYYCPQVPAPGLANAQGVLPHGARPSGPPHSQTGDLCRPYMEPYIRPGGMPMRPGFYQGYYGQPMGFRGPNERDFSIMGRPSGPPFINHYPNQNAPDPINSPARSSGGRTHEQVDLCPPLLDPRATAPVKQIIGWDKNTKEDNFGRKFTANPHPNEESYAANTSSQDNVRGEDPRQYKQIYSGKRSLHSEQAPIIEGKTGSTDPAHSRYHGNTNSAQSDEVNPAVENVDLPRDHTLIQKIEGLNAKVRVSDGKHDISTEEPNGRGQVKSNVSVDEPGATVLFETHYPSGIRVPVSHNRTVLPDNKGFGSTADSAVTTVSRHSSHNLQGRGGNGSKGRFNSQEGEGWRKRSATAESQGIVSVRKSDTAKNIGQKEKQPAETCTTDQEGKDDSKLSMPDSIIEQHVNMKEITKQRAMQIQREEEERIREQKAKAFAKLAELNRRSANQGKETSTQKMDDLASSPESNQKQDGVQKQDEVKSKIELQFGSFQSGEIGVVLPSGYNTSKTAKSSASSASSGSQTNQQLQQEDSVLSKKTSPAVSENFQVYDSTKQKGAGYKQKYGGQSGKNQAEKLTAPGKDKTSPTIAAASKEVNGKEVPPVSDSLMHQKRKNKAGKNKHMVDEAFSASSDVSKGVGESMKPVHVEQKSHKSDTVVWAPVKSHAKMEAADSNDQKADRDSGPSNRNDNGIPVSFKGRRAEIERYIPKAAIKELTQQAIDQLSSSPLPEKSIPDGTICQGRGASSQTTERIKRNVESKHAENKTKQWHQRTSTTSNSPAFDGAHQAKKSQEHEKGSVAAKPVVQIVEVQPSSLQTHEDNAADGWVIYDEPVFSGSDIISSMDDHEKSTRGKKNPYKGNKGGRNQQSNELENHAAGAKGGDTDYFSGAERPRSSKEHRVSQWQPRPQPRVTNLTRGRQNATGLELKQHNQNTEKDPVLPKSCVAERRDMSRVPNSGNQESKVSLESRAYSPNENTQGDFESAEHGSYNDQRPSSSDNRWNGYYNGRPSRGRDFHGGRGFIPQENRHNNAREKQRQSSRFEYQPVGPYNQNKGRGDYSERQSENQHGGPKYRDRGQGGHFQRGGASFSGWQRVNQTDADYE